MSFDQLVRDALGIADSLTESLQAEVEHHPWIGQDVFGTPTYAAPRFVDAIIERRALIYRGTGGQVLNVSARITILRPLQPHGAAGRVEPIDTRDKFVLPDGHTDPIAAISGLIDPVPGQPYYAEVLLGRP